jgi:hypothetical protein
MAPVAQDRPGMLAMTSASEVGIPETAVELREAQLESPGLDRPTFAALRFAREHQRGPAPAGA